MGISDPKTKADIAFEIIAGSGAGLEEDIKELERHWPEARRGTRANRVFQSIIYRARVAVETAREQVK